VSFVVVVAIDEKSGKTIANGGNGENEYQNINAKFATGLRGLGKGLAGHSSFSG
jgi:hypothetical protein